jgi:hypothetical protein
MAKDNPVVMVEKKGGSLSPLSPIDAEILDSFEQGAMFRLEYASRRSNPQNSLYWVMLQRIVDATGRWPSSEALHKQLLIECGHYTPVLSLDGKRARLEADSASFKAMRPKEFKAYMDMAIDKLAEHTGIDPLEFYRELAA